MSGPGLGHNGGPTMEPGEGWRRVAWTKAREALLPTLPIEVVRLRVRRAQELGLPYKTYASVRASTGHDLIGFLFSSNALRLTRNGGLPADRQARLVGLPADRVAVVYRPFDPGDVARIDGLDAACPAPALTQSWSDMRRQIKDITRARGHLGDRYLLVAETALEREWVTAGALAGCISGDAFFAPPSG